MPFCLPFVVEEKFQYARKVSEDRTRLFFPSYGSLKSSLSVRFFTLVSFNWDVGVVVGKTFSDDFQQDWTVPLKVVSAINDSRWFMVGANVQRELAKPAER